MLSLTDESACGLIFGQAVQLGTGGEAMRVRCGALTTQETSELNTIMAAVRLLPSCSNPYRAALNVRAAVRQLCNQLVARGGDTLVNLVLTQCCGAQPNVEELLKTLFFWSGAWFPRDSMLE